MGKIVYKLLTQDISEVTTLFYLTYVNEKPPTRGPKGDTGPSGPKVTTAYTRPQGPIGNKGDVGPRGPKGDIGDGGKRDEIRSRGPKGEKSDTVYLLVTRATLVKRVKEITRATYRVGTTQKQILAI